MLATLCGRNYDVDRGGLLMRMDVAVAVAVLISITRSDRTAVYAIVLLSTAVFVVVITTVAVPMVAALVKIDITLLTLLRQVVHLLVLSIDAFSCTIIEAIQRVVIPDVVLVTELGRICRQRTGNLCGLAVNRRF